MLSYINKSDFNELLKKYQFLEDFKKEIIFYENKERKIYILPRLFCRNFNFDKIKEHKDSTFIPKSSNIKYDNENFKLKERQVNAYKIIKDIYDTKGHVNGIIKARCRFGKTVLASYITSEFKKKTLIIVDNITLLNQWKEDFKRFTNIKDDDIGIVQGKKVQLEKPVIFAMVQTLISMIKKDMKKYYEMFKSSGVDLVFIDEAHATSSAPKFASSTLLFDTNNIIGLTATPNKFDLNKLLLENTIGDIIFEYNTYDIKPDINYVYYNSGLEKYFNRFRTISDPIFKTTYYDKIISKSEKYVDVIFTLVKEILQNPNKKVMVIGKFSSAKSSQIQMILKKLEENNIKTTLLFGEHDDIIHDNDHVIVSGYKKGSRGLTVNNLTDIIFASDFRSETPLIQSVGRILGEFENKPKPNVWHLVDKSFGKYFVDNVERKNEIYKREYGEMNINKIFY